MSQIGYALTRKELRETVKSVLDKAEEDRAADNLPAEPRLFKDNLPSTCWVYRFQKRWPIMSSRLPEKLGYQRTYVTRDKILNWFHDLKNFLQKEHGIDAATFCTPENGSRILNLDESGFPLAGTNGRLQVFAARGTKNVFKVAPDTREQVTVLSCASASGELMKPFVIFPGVRPRFNFEGVDPNDFDVGVSPNGWISSDCFFGWMANLLIPYLESKNVEFPIIIFMDGHTSHVNVAVSEFCREKKVILFCFPPHASHLMQPLDVSVFGPLKKAWNSSLDKFARTYRGLSMSRHHFFSVFDSAWKQAVNSPQNIISGFRKSGLVPLNPEAIDYSKLVAKISVPENDPSTSQNDPSTNDPLTSENGATNFNQGKSSEKMFAILKNQLPATMLTLFETRYENGYDVPATSEQEIPWNIYKQQRDFLEGKSTNPNITLNDSIATDAAEGEETMVTIQVQDTTVIPPTNTPNPDGDSPAPRSAVSNEQMNTPENNLEPIPGPSSDCATRQQSSTPQASNSQAKRKISFDNWKFSPFKKYLKIADHVAITRKESKTKTKVPHAISGAECYKLMQSKQDEKQRQQEAKGKRG